MKFAILFATLITSLFAHAYECTGKDSLGNAIKLKTKMQSGTNVVTLDLGPLTYKEAVKLKPFQGSSMGHSRCPGTWSGIVFEGQNAESFFKSLSIVTDEEFFGCGFAPSDSLTLALENGTEMIHLSCQK